MRLTRDVVASIGVGAFIVAGCIAALFLLSTLLAVEGFPGMDPADDLPSVVLSDAAPTSAGAAGAARGEPTADRSPRRLRPSGPSRAVAAA